jgi:hypothetical protein
MGGSIGYLVGGIGGMMIGGFVLGVVAAIMTFESAAKAAKKPPLVRVQTHLSSSPEKARVTQGVAPRLKRLDDLHAEGAITSFEHEKQRAAIIATL